MNLESIPLTNRLIYCYDYQNKKVVFKIDGKWYLANIKKKGHNCQPCKK